MGRRHTIAEFEILTEHAEQMFFEPHHQRMHPGIEDDIGTFKTHLRRIARGEILHMHRRGNHGAGHAKLLGNMAFHLRAKHQFGLQRGDAFFDFQVIV